MEAVIMIALKVLVYVIGLASVIGIWIGLGLNTQRMRERFKLNQQIKLAAYNRKWLEHPLLRKYHFLLTSSIRKYELNYFSRIVVIQFSIFLLVIVVLTFILKDIKIAAVIAIMLIYALPIGALFLKHKQTQSALQSELVEASVVLLQEYQKNHQHMLYTLKSVASGVSGYSQIAYARLFARMHDDDHMKELAAESFAFQLGHFRGKNLASIILRACKDGTPVEKQLEDLVEDITELNKVVRDAETAARETALIGYAPIPLLILLYFVNDKWLIPDGETFYYQFQTSQGLQWFLISFIFGLIGMGLAIMVKPPRKT